MRGKMTVKIYVMTETGMIITETGTEIVTGHGEEDTGDEMIIDEVLTHVELHLTGKGAAERGDTLTEVNILLEQTSQNKFGIQFDKI